MKKLFILLSLWLIVFSFAVQAGFEGRSSGTSLKIFNIIDCGAGMTCTRSGNGVFSMVGIATGGTLTDGNILVGNGSNVSTSVNPSGDIDISNAGVFSIVSDVIINADVKTDAAIAFSKLATLTDAQFLVGNGSGVATDVAMSGDATLANTGAVTIAANVVTAGKMSVLQSGLLRHCADFDFNDLETAGDGVPFVTASTFPDNSVIVDVWIEILTTFGGDGDDSSLISIGIEDQDNDVVVAVAIKTGTPWDAGFQDTILDDIDDQAKWLKTTAARGFAITGDIAATDTAFDAGDGQVCALYYVSR